MCISFESPIILINGPFERQALIFILFKSNLLLKLYESYNIKEESLASPEHVIFSASRLLIEQLLYEVYINAFEFNSIFFNFTLSNSKVVSSLNKLSDKLIFHYKYILNKIKNQIYSVNNIYIYIFYVKLENSVFDMVMVENLESAINGNEFLDIEFVNIEFDIL